MKRWRAVGGRLHIAGFWSAFVFVSAIVVRLL
jgi:hypothetical protein